MAQTKKTPPPRPSKNADGQQKQPSANPTGGPPAAPPQAGPPSLVPPGGPPAVPGQAGGPPQAPQPGMPPGMPGMQPQAPMGSFAPAEGMGQRSDARTQINYKDMDPMAQAQAKEQAGINPAAGLEMIQGQLQSSMQAPGGPAGPPQTGPVPPAFIGPMVPPGVENFPHDMAALMQMMQRGYAPGADAAEHQQAMNAHSIARAMEQQTQNQASNNVGAHGVNQALAGLMSALQANGHIPGPMGGPDPNDPRRKNTGFVGPVGNGMTSSPQGAPQLSNSY